MIERIQIMLNQERFEFKFQNPDQWDRFLRWCGAIGVVSQDGSVNTDLDQLCEDELYKLCCKPHPNSFVEILARARYEYLTFQD
jgi:hypothetical protein